MAQHAAAAFIARRSELGLTQEDVAELGGLCVRTVQNFESGVKPQPKTRACLERAVQWEPGKITRLAGLRDGDIGAAAAVSGLAHWAEVAAQFPQLDQSLVVAIGAIAARLDSRIGAGADGGQHAA